MNVAASHAEAELPSLEALVGESYEKIQRRGDRLITTMVLIHCLVAALIAPAYNTWLVALVVAPIAASIYFVARLLAPSKFVVRVAAGISLQVFVALHIFQDHGLSEQHFWFFTATTAMIVYQDRAAMWPGVILIIAQHILFAYLHNSGVELFFFEDAYVATRKLAFHFGIALIQVALAASIASALHAQTLRDAELRLAQLRATRAAELSAEARSSFLACVSHELRTPMNGIEGMADALLATQLDGDQHECAETIRASSAALVCLVNDILDYSKSESGEVELVTEPFSPARVAKDVVAMLDAHARGKGVDLAAKIEEGLPVVCGDGSRLRQVLYNLVGNGIKFSPEGRVTLEVASGCESSEGIQEIQISVADTGIGIAEDELESIFEPFRQAQSAKQVSAAGTGLGLTITSRIVKAMGGEISVASAPGEGSTFTVRLKLELAPPAALTPDVLGPLPKEQRAETAERAVRDATRESIGLHVLVVEDDLVNRKVASRLLKLL
ncbi:MAG: ATP-binding protein, partial [Planctomycetota bacterium]